jgi:predicted metalloprotease
VQNLLGIADKVHSATQRMSEEQANQMQVRMELQADCLAGVWTHHAQKQRQILEQGDVEEALGAAAAVGDDRLQQEARGYVVPESFTHGSSSQRAKWFTTGAKTGDLNACNTFKTRSL